MKRVASAVGEESIAIAFVHEVLHESTRVSMPAKQKSGRESPPPESLVARVRGEYFEMPGLRLTLGQACRLWQVDVFTCEMLLEYLVREAVLCKTDSGFYIAAVDTRRRSRE